MKYESPPYLTMNLLEMRYGLNKPHCSAQRSLSPWRVKRVGQQFSQRFLSGCQSRAKKLVLICCPKIARAGFHPVKVGKPSRGLPVAYQGKQYPLGCQTDSIHRFSGIADGSLTSISKAAIYIGNSITTSANTTSV